MTRGESEAWAELGYDLIPPTLPAVPPPGTGRKVWNASREEWESVSSTPESVFDRSLTRVLGQFPQNEQMGTHGGTPRADVRPEVFTLDRDQQAAFYLLREAEHRATQADHLLAYSTYGNGLAEFETGVADRLFEIAHALLEGRLTITPAGQTYAQQVAAGQVGVEGYDGEPEEGAS